ncbi:MAG TPA: hypothetical protein VNH43_03100, partial [Vicinamibacteria bacterium]|nr:hypothetical protein [Vicinamibacteria bacterium]
DSGPTYRLAEVLRARGIPHHLDDWGPEGGHDWPYWKHQMDVYVDRLFEPNAAHSASPEEGL